MQITIVSLLSIAMWKRCIESVVSKARGKDDQNNSNSEEWKKEKENGKWLMSSAVQCFYVVKTSTNVLLKIVCKKRLVWLTE